MTVWPNNSTPGAGGLGLPAHGGGEGVGDDRFALSRAQEGFDIGPGVAVQAGQEGKTALLQEGEEPERREAPVHDEQIVFGQMGGERDQQGTLGQIETAQDGFAHQPRGGDIEPQRAGEHVGLSADVRLDAELGLVFRPGR